MLQLFNFYEIVECSSAHGPKFMINLSPQIKLVVLRFDCSTSSKTLILQVKSFIIMIDQDADSLMKKQDRFNNKFFLPNLTSPKYSTLFSK